MLILRDPRVGNEHIKIKSEGGLVIYSLCQETHAVFVCECFVTCQSKKSLLKPSRTFYLYNFDPLKSHFYLVKLEFTGVYIIFLISAQKHRLWVFVRTASPRRF